MLNPKFFTLIEVLVTISIVLILTSLIVVFSPPFQQMARDNQRREALGTYQVALQEYYGDYKTYPNPVPGGGETEEDTCNNTVCSDGTNCCSYNSGECTCLAHLYLTVLEDDGFLSPLPVDPLDEGNYRYYYTIPDNGKAYKLFVKLERDKDAMENDDGIDPLVYEVFSGRGVSLVIHFPTAEETVAFYCEILSPAECNGKGGIKVIGVEDPTSGGHAELPSGGNYAFVVCCFGPEDLGNDCTAANKEIILELSNTTGALVSEH